MANSTLEPIVAMSNAEPAVAKNITALAVADTHIEPAMTDTCTKPAVATSSPKPAMYSFLTDLCTTKPLTRPKLDADVSQGVLEHMTESRADLQSMSNERGPRTATTEPTITGHISADSVQQQPQVTSEPSASLSSPAQESSLPTGIKQTLQGCGTMQFGQPWWPSAIAQQLPLGVGSTTSGSRLALLSSDRVDASTQQTSRGIEHIVPNAPYSSLNDMDASCKTQADHLQRQMLARLKNIESSHPEDEGNSPIRFLQPVRTTDLCNKKKGKKGKELVNPRQSDLITFQTLHESHVRKCKAVHGTQLDAGWAFQLNDHRELTTREITSIQAGEMFEVQKMFIVERQVTVNKLASLSSTDLLQAVASRSLFFPNYQTSMLDNTILTKANLLADGNIGVAVLAEKRSRLTELQKQVWILPYRHIDPWNDGGKYEIVVRSINGLEWGLRTRMDKARAVDRILRQNRVRIPTLLEHPINDIW